MTRDEIRRRRELRERTCELAWEDGLSEREIAGILDTTRSTVSQLVRDMRRDGRPLERRR